MVDFDLATLLVRHPELHSTSEELLRDVCSLLREGLSAVEISRLRAGIDLGDIRCIRDDEAFSAHLKAYRRHMRLGRLRSYQEGGAIGVKVLVEIANTTLALDKDRVAASGHLTKLAIAADAVEQKEFDIADLTDKVDSLERSQAETSSFATVSSR